MRVTIEDEKEGKPVILFVDEVDSLLGSRNSEVGGEVRTKNQFLTEIPVTFPLLMDPGSKIKALYNVFTQPVTYFIDKQGIIVDKKFGPLTPQEIENKFGKLGLN